MRVISIITLVGFLAVSCLVNKKVNNNVIQTIINDYVIDFNKGKSNLESILIIVDEDKSKVDIIDYPYEHLYADIRNKQDSLSSIKIGVYNDLPIKVVCDNKNILESCCFVRIDSSLITKANLKHVAYDEKGRELDFIIDEGLTSYDPFLVSNYYVKKRLKILHYRNGEIYKRKY